jgi:archaellum component FlaC
MTEEYNVNTELSRVAGVQNGVLEDIKGLRAADSNLDKAISLLDKSLGEINRKLDTMMNGSMEICRLESTRIKDLENCVNTVVDDLSSIKRTTARIAWLFVSSIIAVAVGVISQRLQIHF